MRRNLSTELADSILDILADGHFEPGSRIDIATLGRQLEVSDTPLREALANLAGQGLVERRARLGYFTAPLDERTVRSAYELRATHLSAALSLSPAPSRIRLRALRAHGSALNRHPADPQEVLDLTDAWFLDLVGGCENAVLLAMVRSSLVRVRPLERGRLAAGDAGLDLPSFRRMVESRMAEGDLRAAADALRDCLRADVTRAVEWYVRTRPTASGMRRRKVRGRPLAIGP